jgi:hypothetical protein
MTNHHEWGSPPSYSEVSGITTPESSSVQPTSVRNDVPWLSRLWQVQERRGEEQPLIDEGQLKKLCDAYASSTDGHASFNAISQETLRNCAWIEKYKQYLHEINVSTKDYDSLAWKFKDLNMNLKYFPHMKYIKHNRNLIGKWAKDIWNIRYSLQQHLDSLVPPYPGPSGHNPTSGPSGQGNQA